MHKLLALVFFLFAGIAGIAGIAQAKNDALPSNFKLKGLEGGVIKPADLDNQLIVIQFWASWCQGCGDVMGDLNKLLKNVDPSSIKYLPVSVDETVAEARSYFSHQRSDVKPLRKIAYLDVDAKLATELDITALPAVVVIDKKGHVVRRIVGHPTKKQMNDIKSLTKK